MNNEQRPVFCRDCEFLCEWHGYNAPVIYSCSAPGNLKWKFRTNHIMQWEYAVKMRSPKRINRYHNCQWFKAREQSK